MTGGLTTSPALAVLCLSMPLWPAPVQQEAREVIARRCLACHSPQVRSGGLDLSSRASALTGGGKGPAVKPSSTGASLLLTRVQNGSMPPTKPLDPNEIETLRRWIDSGAPDWGGPISARRSGPDWWAWQPVVVQAPPDVAETTNTIDRWVRAKLRTDGLRPAPLADRRTLIRRVTFGLTGLPPTPEDVAAFVADQRPNAYELVVDRLLRSPHYGEHWARHWLDIVRYAESEGFERDWLRDHVWPYRDYVIRAFNDDKPYPQFVKEQLAGDVIDPPTRDGVIATTFLVLGPTDAVGLTSAVPQERALVRADQLEDMIGLVSQTFLGLTVNCARCHDHKFDPIPQRDYYRMKAVFDGVWQPTSGDELRAEGRALLDRTEVAAYEHRIAAAESRILALEENLARIDRTGRPPHPPPVSKALMARWPLDTDARDDTGPLHALSVNGEATFAEGRLRADKSTVTITTHPLQTEVREKTLEAWIRVTQAPEKAITVFRIRNRSGYRGAAIDGIHFAGGKKKQWENTSTVRFRTEDVDGPAEDTRPGDRIHVAISYAADGEIRIYRNGQPFGRAYRPDAGSSHGRLQTYGSNDAVIELSSGNGLELEEARLYGEALTPAQVAASFQAGTVNAAAPSTHERRQAALELADARASVKSIAAPEKVFAAEIRPAEPTRLLLRGDVNRPGEMVSPGGVSLLRTPPSDLRLAPDADEGERRRRFADWVVNPQNPLWARVIVNRVWHYHFGAGFVESPNDFGFNGGLPSHPELLDYLAAEFIKSGGSVKHLQKLILMSATYQQSSQFNSSAAAHDASARLLWRFPPQRLAGEVVRDAMLVAGGVINNHMFGPSFRPFQIVKNPGSYHSYDPVDSPAAEFQRRTIYRMNVNSGGNPLLDALDCPLPSVKTPRRSSTTTALQALSLMNNPFVDRLSKALAQRVERERDSAATQIARAYELVLGRPPRPEETASATALAAKAGLPAFCWALLNTSEFLYVQ